MSLTKSNILTYVNDKLNRSETDIDDEIQEILDELADEDLLIATDESQSLESGDTSLDYPTNYKQLVVLTLNDGTYDSDPLERVSHKEYREWMKNGNSSDYSEPEYYSEFDGKFWLYPVPDGDYTAKIEHYKYHPAVADGILFGDEFKTCINAGAVWSVATAKGLSRYIGIWYPKYERAKQKRIDNADIQPYVVRG